MPQETRENDANPTIVQTVFAELYHDVEDFDLPLENGYEDPKMYTEFGFCPIHLGDKLNNGRYEILYKIGSGHSSTVWLARDTQCPTAEVANLPPRYVAVRVLRAAVSSNAIQATLLPRLQHPAVVPILDNFSHKSQNGDHMILVMPVVRPLSEWTWGASLSDHRDVILRLLEGIAYLHRNHIVHGDVHLGNLGYICDPVSDSTLERLPPQDAFWTPPRALAKHGPALPRYIVSSQSWMEGYHVDQDVSISTRCCLLDFCSAFQHKKPSSSMESAPCQSLPMIVATEPYMAPEYVFETRVPPPTSWIRRYNGDASKDLVGDNLEKVDVWGLGCSLYELISDMPLIDIGKEWQAKPEMMLGVDSNIPTDWSQLPNVPLCEPHKSTPECPDKTQIFWDYYRWVVSQKFEADVRCAQSELCSDGFTGLLRYMLRLDPRVRPSAEDVIDFIEQSYPFTEEVKDAESTKSYA